MNYSELTTALAKSFETLSDSDLQSLNKFLVNEINERIRQKRDAVRSTLKVGSRVTINDPRCRGKFYIVQKFTGKSAVLSEENSLDLPSAISPKIRATITLLELA
jgi:hypothetical protein